MDGRWCSALTTPDPRPWPRSTGLSDHMLGRSRRFAHGRMVDGEEARLPLRAGRPDGGSGPPQAHRSEAPRFRLRAPPAAITLTA